MWHFKGVKTKHTLTPPTYFQGVKTPNPSGSTPLGAAEAHLVRYSLWQQIGRGQTLSQFHVPPPRHRRYKSDCRYIKPYRNKRRRRVGEIYCQQVSSGGPAQTHLDLTFRPVTRTLKLTICCLNVSRTKWMIKKRVSRIQKPIFLILFTNVKSVQKYTE